MIPAIQELDFPKKEGKQYATLTHATVNLADMGEKTISTQVKIDGDITPDFSQDWVVEFQGEKYIMPLRQPQGAKENTSLNSTIDLTFQHWAIYQLKRWMFFTVQPVETGTAVADKYIASVSLNLSDFCGLFSQVLERHYGESITIDLNPNPAIAYGVEAVNIEISYSHIWDVLINLYELFAVRWEIVPRADNDNHTDGGERYVIKVGYTSTKLDHIFKYGFEGGLLKVERQVQSEDIRNMLLGRGGEKNIPYRYFKDIDPQNPSFPADPDWIPEVANIYFDRLRGKTYRDYIKGWKTNPLRQLKGNDGTDIIDSVTGLPIQVEPYDASYGEKNWAYKRGHDDVAFDPVEFVKDDESIAKYGPLLGGLDDNEEIYPTIQGIEADDIGRIDEAIEIEQVQNDDVQEAAEDKATTAKIDGVSLTFERLHNGERAQLTVKSDRTFTVPEGQTGIFDPGLGVAQFGVYTYRKGWDTGFKKIWYKPSSMSEDLDGDIEIEKTSVVLYDAATGERHSTSGIPPGSYFYEVSISVYNKRDGSSGDEPLRVIVSFGSPELTYADIEKKWEGTFDIWIKNIWGTHKAEEETDLEYVQRVWKPILGDKIGDEAKVVFSDGALSTSQDYEFIITAYPEYEQKPCEWTDGHGVRHKYMSEWRLTLGKSSADMKSTGLYVPSTKRQGKAGDHFFFTGIDMPHYYVLWAETALDDWKKDQLREKKDIKPTWVITTDRVRLNNEGKANALIQQLRIGNSLRLADKRFITETNEQGEVVPSSPETLYLQSITYTYREPTGDDAALNPDVGIVLSDKYEVAANPVSTIQGSVDAIQRQLGSISNVEQIVRAVGDRLYLRKDGIHDMSLSPTAFASLLTSYDFRQGIVGGNGWGFYRDDSGRWVLEADRINIRQDLRVNNFVINQISIMGGKEISCAASFTISSVKELDDGYVCYFDQKNGSKANLFVVDDIAMSQVYDEDYKENKFYKRRVIAVSDNSVTLSKIYANGDGIPEEGDTIAHYGNYDPASGRTFVKVRDVIGGGYERYLEGLTSVHADGIEYCFIGKQDGQNPRFFIGSHIGEYLEFKDGRLVFNGSLSLTSTIGDKTVDKYIDDKVGDLSTYILSLSTETTGVACDADGNVLEGTPPSSAITVYKGNVDDTGNWNVSAESFGCDVDIHYDPATGAPRVEASSIESDVSTIVVTASRTGFAPLTATMTIYKVKPGQNGNDAILYSIEPSVDVIKKTAIGEVEPSEIYCTVYRTEGSGPRQPSNLYTLKIQRLGIDSAEIPVSRTDGQAQLFTVTSACVSVRYSLYDGASLLARTNIPVLADASDFEIGGDNLLRDSEFRYGPRFWGYDKGYAEVDGSMQVDGRPSVKIDIQGMDGYTYWGISQEDTRYLYASFGRQFVASIYSYTDNLDGIDADAMLEVRFISKEGVHISSKSVSIVPGSELAWERFSLPFTCPANTYRLRFYVWLGRNGRLWLNSPMLESGNRLTAWVRNPADTDYLTEALKEGTTIDGGLVQTSLIMLGYTEQDGEYVVMSGTNGMYSADKPGGGLAFWAGGRPVDPADPGRGDKRPSMFGVRMDGSVYAAGNTVRLSDGIIEIGDNVQATDRGFYLKDGDNTPLAIANDRIDPSLAESFTPHRLFNWQSPSGMFTESTYDETNSNTILSIMSPKAYTVDMGFLYKGDVLELDSLYGELQYWPGRVLGRPLTQYLNSSVRMSIYDERDRYIGGWSAIWEIESLSDLGHLDFPFYYYLLKPSHSQPNMPVTIDADGNYKVVVRTNGADLGNKADIQNPAVAASWNAFTAARRSTLLYNDGFYTGWDNSQLFISNALGQIRVGDNGIRISHDGIYLLTENGSRWKKIKFTLE